MPEVITKHPQQLIQLLKAAKMKCGDAKTKPLILTSCPSESFCKIPQGEICVYGIQSARNMDQFGTLDFFKIPMVGLPLFFLFLIVFLFGILAGKKIAKK